MTRVRWKAAKPKTDKAVSEFLAMGGLPPPGVPFWGYDGEGKLVILKKRRGVYFCPKCGTALHKNRKGPCEPTECYAEYEAWRREHGVHRGKGLRERSKGGSREGRGTTRREGGGVRWRRQ